MMKFNFYSRLLIEFKSKKLYDEGVDQESVKEKYI